jgi:hypothetical protein
MQHALCTLMEADMCVCVLAWRGRGTKWDLLRKKSTCKNGNCKSLSAEKRVNAVRPMHPRIIALTDSVRAERNNVCLFVFLCCFLGYFVLPFELFCVVMSRFLRCFLCFFCGCLCMSKWEENRILDYKQKKMPKVNGC